MLYVLLHLYSVHFVYDQRALAYSYVGGVPGAAIAPVATLSGHRLSVLELSSSIRIWSIFAVVIQSLKIRTHRWFADGFAIATDVDGVRCLNIWVLKLLM